MSKNPRATKSLTPDEETTIHHAEQQHIRAEVIAAGVAAALKGEAGGYCGVSLLDECASMLTEAADFHRSAYRLQEKIKTKHAVPVPRNRMRRR